jgi:hypothetical protein
MTEDLYRKIRERQESRGLVGRHVFLLKGTDAAECLERIRRYLSGYDLLRYSRVESGDAPSMPASDPAFQRRLEESVAENRHRLQCLLDELRREGIETLEDLGELSQGHLTNTLHTATHLLDGFFGIDSYFFNLVEGTHEVSDTLREKIASDPGHYMLVSVIGTF